MSTRGLKRRRPKAEWSDCLAISKGPDRVIDLGGWSDFGTTADEAFRRGRESFHMGETTNPYKVNPYKDAWSRGYKFQMRYSVKEGV